jgi:hypothetical protein
VAVSFRVAFETPAPPDWPVVACPEVLEPAFGAAGPDLLDPPLGWVACPDVLDPAVGAAPERDPGPLPLVVPAELPELLFCVDAGSEDRPPVPADEPPGLEFWPHLASSPISLIGRDWTCLNPRGWPPL